MSAADLGAMALLRAENKSAKEINLQIYADALATYREAADNIEKNGAIVLHPRTGAPIDNPYLKVRASAAATLLKMKNIKSDRLMAAIKKGA